MIVTGLMSLMQFWTKFYAQLGRPPPKVEHVNIFSMILVSILITFIRKYMMLRSEKVRFYRLRKDVGYCALLSSLKLFP